MAAHYDAIIVLGGGINLDGSVSEADVVRLSEVASLFEAGSSKAIIVCGSFGYKAVERPPISEAQAYADFLENHEVPRSSIYLEDYSKETVGNILFTKINILLEHGWHKLLVIPTHAHSTERISYLLEKILGNGYDWEILRIGEDKDPANLEREAKSLHYTKEINDQFINGDHEAIYKGLQETHPAYGGTKWTVKELRDELS